MVDNPCFVLDESAPPPMPRPVSKQKRRCQCGRCGHCQLFWMLRQKNSEEEEGEHTAVEHLVLDFQRWPGRQSRPSDCVELRVPTSFGDVVIGISGSPDLPAIMTYHDLGLNYAVLLDFFKQKSMRVISSKFCVHHVCAPGQEEDAKDLPDNYTYPSIDELAKQVDEVCKYMNIDHFMGFGVGLGANVLLRYAMRYPKKVDGLVVVNATTSAISWKDWAHQKIVYHTLSAHGMTPVVLEYLLRHIFGYRIDERCPGTAAFYREYIQGHINPNNLARLMSSWNKRSALSISRSTVTVRAPVLNATGDLSLHVEDTVCLNARLSPEHASWIKFQDAGSVINECPDKMAQAIRLFMQCEGLVPGGSMPRDEQDPPQLKRVWRTLLPRCSRAAVMRIIENPLLDANQSPSVC